jgi:hypothetical protein
MNIERSSKGEFRTGTGTVGVASQQADMGFKAAKSVTIKADAANTGTLYLGHDNSVSATTGFPLAKGESIEIDVDSVDKIWVVGSAAGQKYAWMAA